MGFLFRKTTGRTSNFLRSRVFSEDGKYGRDIPKLDPLLFTPFLSPDEGLWHQKFDGRCTYVERLFAVINFRYYAWENRCGSGVGSGIGGSRGKASIGPRGLRVSEPIERKITNHAVQSGRF